MFTIRLFSIIAAVTMLLLLIPSPAIESSPGRDDDYVVVTNWTSTGPDRGYFNPRVGVDPDPGNGDSYIPEYNVYDWMYTDGTGVTQSELDSFINRCSVYAAGFGIDGVDVLNDIQHLQSNVNRVQIVVNHLVYYLNGDPMESAFTLFFPPNFNVDPSNRYPMILQCPGYGVQGLNSWIFNSSSNLPLGFMTVCRAAQYDDDQRGLIFINWNAGGYKSVGANSGARTAIGSLVHQLHNNFGCDRHKIITRGGSRGAFTALTTAENVLHHTYNYTVLGVFAASPPLSLGTLSTIPTATYPELSALYRLNAGPDAYRYDNTPAPGETPHEALLPVFGTTDELDADRMCPDYSSTMPGETDNIESLDGKYVFLSYGTHDAYFPFNYFLDMDNTLSQKGINHTSIIVVRGGHSPSPKSEMNEIFRTFVLDVLNDDDFDPRYFIPPAPYKHGLYEEGRNYYLDTDLETHEAELDGESLLKPLFLKELPFSVTIPRRLGCNVYGDGQPNRADEPGIVYMSGPEGGQWDITITNQSTGGYAYGYGIFDGSESIDVTWWRNSFPVPSWGYCGPGETCWPENDWLSWLVFYDGENVSENVNWTVDQTPIELETEIIDRQAEPAELYVRYWDTSTPAVAMGVDAFQKAVAHLAVTPESGQMPLDTVATIMLANNSQHARRLSFRIDFTRADGQLYESKWSGYKTVQPYSTWIYDKPQRFPESNSLIGENTFRMVIEDTTPAPYNQPPYPPSGATDTHMAIVTIQAP